MSDREDISGESTVTADDVDDAATSFAPGQLLGGRFRLDHLLGRGGMGQVWAATHEVTEQRHAIKVLNREHESESLRKRFLREARAASRVKHPNVISIQDIFTLDSGAPAMVMDLLEGETLRELLHREEQLPLAEVASLMLPVLEAVGAAHDAGVVHRDLKPENIFVSSAHEGAARIHVLDFGLAKLTRAPEDGQMTATGQVMGTPLYMSPEQLLGETDIDAATDVWALGVILYEALSGGRPIEAAHPGKMLEAILERGHTPIASILPELPEEVAANIERALTRDRAARPSLTELADVLGSHTSSEGVAIRPAAATSKETPSFAMATTEVTPPAASRSDEPEPAANAQTEADTEAEAVPPTPGRSRLVLAAAAVALAAVAGASWLGGGAEDSEARTGEAHSSKSQSTAPPSVTAPTTTKMATTASSTASTPVARVSATAPTSRASATATVAASAPPAAPARPRPLPRPEPVAPAPKAEPTYGGGVVEDPPD